MKVTDRVKNHKLQYEDTKPDKAKYDKFLQEADIKYQDYRDYQIKKERKA